MEFMKVGFPPINIKFTDRVAYYNAFDEYNIKHDIAAMEKLFAKYVNERLDMYLKILQVKNLNLQDNCKITGYYIRPI